MVRTPGIDESKLTKMELRKLNALRKSVGDEIAARAFSQWLKERPARASSVGQRTDRTATAIAGAVEGLIADRTIRSIPRGGYIVKRGRGRVVVSRHVSA